jgi:hypothetical protein
MCEEVHLPLQTIFGCKEIAEKGRDSSRSPKSIPQGLKPVVYFVALAERLKSFPDTSCLSGGAFPQHDKPFIWDGKSRPGCPVKRGVCPESRMIVRIRTGAGSDFDAVPDAEFKNFRKIDFVVSHPFHKGREMDGARGLLALSVKMFQPGPRRQCIPAGIASRPRALLAAADASLEAVGSGITQAAHIGRPIERTW